MPTKTYTTPNQNKIKGWKKSKDRVTLMPCYAWSKNAWMMQEIFEKRFHQQFVTQVKQFLQTINKEQKALFFYDDCSAHSQELISSCGNIMYNC